MFWIIAVFSLSFGCEGDEDHLIDATLAQQAAASSETAEEGTEGLSPEQLEELQTLQTAANNRRKIVVLDETGNAPFDNHTMTIGSAVTLKAGIYDFDNTFIEDADVIWSLQNGSFPSSTLSETGVSSSLIFTPSITGTTAITASYAGASSDVVVATDTTGIITVESDQIPDSVTLYAGDSQSAAVLSILPTNLSVVVKDRFGDPIQGISVSFTATSGPGTVLTGMPTLTDESGIANASVQFGSVTGTYKFKAVVDSETSLNVEWTTTATPGAAASINFATEPGGAFATAPFTNQPLVQLLDASGNIVTNATGSILLSVAVGSGALSGSTSVSVSNGVVSFSDIAYDSAEAGVKVRATFGGISGDSAAFTVAALPPGACQREDGYFSTAGGGCKDLISELVWSSRQGAVNWYASIWDEALGGNVGTDDAGDYGRKNDYGNDPESGPDNSTTNTCHDLTEGGQSDWRMATLSEYSTLFAHLTAGTRPYLDVEDTTYIWTSKTYTSSTKAYGINLSTGVSTNINKTSSYPTYCVRGGIDNSLTIALTQSPAYVEENGTGMVSVNPFIVQIQDSGGALVQSPGLNITATSNLGTLSGTTTVTTDVLGIAEFPDLQLDTMGTATLSFSATGYTTVTVDVEVREFANMCKVENGAWQSTEGGCKYLATGLVFSLTSPSPMTWYQAVWGYVASTFNLADPPEASDGANLNDYDNDPGAYIDNSVENYCHELVESGYDDWRMVTNSEITTIQGHGYTSLSSYITSYYDSYLMTSTTHASTSKAYVYLLDSSANTNGNKTSSYSVLCVREP